MTDSIDSSELRKLRLDFDRQYFIRKWLTQSGSHMATYHHPPNSQNSTETHSLKSPYVGVDGQKPKMRSFNSHDTRYNMFSVADFENARLVRRNEIEMKKRLLRRIRSGCNGVSETQINKIGSTANDGIDVCRSGLNECSPDCSTGDSMMSLQFSDSQQDPLPADKFFERYSTPTFVRISYKMKPYDETLQSFSSNGSAATTSSTSAEGQSEANGFCITPTGSSNSPGSNNTVASSSTASSSANIHPSVCIDGKSYIPAVRKFPTENKDSNQKLYSKQGDLFLIYKMINQRNIYHGNVLKMAVTNRKKAVLIPQEFTGYFSLMDDKGLPRATQYTSLMQLVRERVSKFISVDPIPAFAESQTNQKKPTSEECIQNYSKSVPNRLQYFRTTARGGVYRLIAVFEDNYATNACTNINVNTHKLADQRREKEKNRYAQLMNDARQVFYASLGIKGKFYEVEPGVPLIFQRTGANDMEKKINPDCIYRITDLITPKTNLPVSLYYVSGPNTNTTDMPECVRITKISKENILIACPVDENEKKCSFHLQKLYLTEEMNLLRSNLGFDKDKNMWSDPNVQSMLKYCQFNCDLFLQTVEKETLQLPERPCSKQRNVGAKFLKPLHFTKLLRREKTTISADEKEGSIIFLTKTDLDNLEAKENLSYSRTSTSNGNAGNVVPVKMNVFQHTKKQWFRREDKLSLNSISSLDAHMKSMSMERYKDMSRLLQDRFGEKSNWTSKSNINIESPSERGCSDIESTALSEIKTKLNRLEQAASMKNEPVMNSNVLLKSLSLQDIESKCQRFQPHSTTYTSESISEAELSTQNPTQIASFITEKLYNEFHEKSHKFSKSSSSLNKLLNFSQPQKMQLSDHKRILAKLRDGFNKNSVEGKNFKGTAQATSRNAAVEKKNPIDANSQKSYSHALSSNIPYFIEDELPYSSVRDSLVLSSDTNEYVEVNRESNSEMNPAISDVKEDVKDEFISCPEMGTSNGFGDYASLYRLEKEFNHNQQSVRTIFADRKQIQINANSIGFHTVLISPESHHGESESCGCGSCCSHDSPNLQQSCDRSHITTVELLGTSYSPKVIETGDTIES